jgi:cathepsin B
VSALPDDFDWSKEAPNCVHPILNQKKCGGCWAFSATEALSDRFCLASNEEINVVLSP